MAPLRASPVVLLALCVACATPDASDGGDPDDTGDDDNDEGTCALQAATTQTGEENDRGCALLERDTSGCADARAADGLSGAWLHFSCRVELAVDGDTVSLRTDGLPDHASSYFDADDPCHEDESGALLNPNRIASQDFTLKIPLVPDEVTTDMRGLPAVGAAIDGVVVFSNTAAPGDDIYEEARTFDRCGAHPQMTGIYHYHSEPYAISDNDARFIGMMLDGYPIYGRQDDDGSTPELDEHGGHVGMTADAAEPAYHYHLHEEISTNPESAGQRAFFLSTGWFRGTPGTCEGDSCARPGPPP